MSKFGAFYDAKILFTDYTSYTHPLSFEEWKSKPDQLKAALLFVQFYNEITLAWDKADSIDFGEDSEGVSTVLQYLQKQVSQLVYFKKDEPTKKAGIEFRRNNPEGFITVEKRTIEEDPKKFNPAYIYRVAYNCLYCICGHDRKCDKDRIENETSGIVVTNGEEFNLIDAVVDQSKCVELVAERNSFEAEFWSVIEDSGASTEKVMRYLLSHDPKDLKALDPSSELYTCDPLRDIEVSLAEVEDILNELRDKFLDMPISSECGQYILGFCTV